MCGIVGVFCHDPIEDQRGHVSAMIETISHRGPDGKNIWYGDGATLGHCRLAVLDISERGSQPILTTDAAGALVYNGEIYNADELRERLVAEGCAFTSSGDTEVVLQALHRWGPQKAIPLFNGMFALAYLDRREDTMWMARDRLGIKPLAMARHGDRVIFASEIKALNAHPSFEGKVRSNMIARWLGEPRVPAHLLLVDGAVELPPGALWRCERGGEITKNVYFALPEAVDVSRIVGAGSVSKSSLVNEAEALISQSVRAHLASDVPLACMCSGGVDSSLITAFAKRDVSNLVAYVADVAGTGEAVSALEVGRHVGVEIRQIKLERESFLHLWPVAVHHADGPPFHASDMALLAVANAARADGFKVLLTGEGSDELFAGYNWQAATQRRWLRLEGIRGLLRLPHRTNMKRMRFERLPFVSPWPDGMYNRVLVAYGGHPVSRQRVLMSHLADIQPVSERALAATCIFELGNHLRWLLHRHDRIGMAASIEMRVPFLENKLIDFALHLPSGARIRRGKTKWLVKAIADRHLPRSIVHAPKQGFPVPPIYWTGCESILSNGRLEMILGWTREERNALMENLAHDRTLAFHLISLELWLRQRLDKQSPETQAQHLVALSPCDSS